MKAATIMAAAASALLAGCNAERADENSGVTAEDAAKLNETEAMLDASMGNEMPMDDLGADTGELPVTGAAANAQ